MGLFEVSAALVTAVLDQVQSQHPANHGREH
jgi:hypothetical protein